MRLRDFITAALVSLAAAGAIAGVVEAGMKAGPNMAGPGHHRLKSPAAEAPPLDGLPVPSGAYGFRQLMSSYAGPGVRLRRISDSLEADINYLGFVPSLGAPLDVVAANSHCTATTCAGRTWYDQSGAARDLVQTTAGNQFPLAFTCQATLPCWRGTLATHSLSSVGNFTPTGPLSLVLILRRSAGTGAFTFRTNGAGSALVGARSALAGNIVSTSGGSIVTAADGATIHSIVGIVDGASSKLYVDGVETTGSISAVLTAGLTGMFGTAATTNEFVEAMFWNNYVLSPAVVAAITANQRSFWAF